MEKFEKICEFEVKFKDFGEWFKVNWVEYVFDWFGFIDCFVYWVIDFLGCMVVEEIVCVELVDDGLVIVCSFEVEIYVVEEVLCEFYG